MNPIVAKFRSNKGLYQPDGKGNSESHEKAPLAALHLPWTGRYAALSRIARRRREQERHTGPLAPCHWRCGFFPGRLKQTRRIGSAGTRFSRREYSRRDRELRLPRVPVAAWEQSARPGKRDSGAEHPYWSVAHAQCSG